jgi:hypothetical protein
MKNDSKRRFKSSLLSFKVKNKLTDPILPKIKYFISSYSKKIRLLTKETISSLLRYNESAYSVKNISKSPQLSQKNTQNFTILNYEDLKQPSFSSFILESSPKYFHKRNLKKQTLKIILPHLEPLKKFFDN